MRNGVEGHWNTAKNIKALRPANNPPVPPADHTTSELSDPLDVFERAALIEEGEGVDRHEADVRALAEVGFSSWQALALAHADRIIVELSRLPAPCDATGARLLAGTAKFITGAHWLACVEHGWCLSDVFGLDEWAPHDCKAALGLVPRVAFFPSAGRRLIEIGPDGATFREAGERLAVFRRPSLITDVSTAVEWWRSRAIVSDEAA